MDSLGPTPWRQQLDRLRGRLDGTLDTLALAIKDALLDWGPEEDGDGGAVTPLPPLRPEEFVAALSGRVEQTLRSVADAINETPAGQLAPASEERVCDLFAQLWCEALEVGQRMRRQAADREALPVPPPQSEWARKYRRMHQYDGWPSEPL